MPRLKLICRTKEKPRSNLMPKPILGKRRRGKVTGRSPGCVLIARSINGGVLRAPCHRAWEHLDICCSDHIETPFTDIWHRNRYFQGPDVINPVQANIKKLFDYYRGIKAFSCHQEQLWTDSVSDDPKTEPDRIGIEGAQKYLTDLQVELDEVAHFALCELLQSPSIGEFTRDEFINGWRNVSTVSMPCDTAARQADYVTTTIRRQLADDQAYFRTVYRYSFKVAKPEQQRSIPADSAVEFWNLFFRAGRGGTEWNSASTKWLDLWIQYYETQYKRPVNKDLWNMVGELMLKTTQPDGDKLEWWTEDGAWPMAIDDFISQVRQSRGGQMDTS